MPMPTLLEILLFASTIVLLIYGMGICKMSGKQIVPMFIPGLLGSGLYLFRLLHVYQLTQDKQWRTWENDYSIAKPFLDNHLLVGKRYLFVKGKSTVYNLHEYEVTFEQGRTDTSGHMILSNNTSSSRMKITRQQITSNQWKEILDAIKSGS